MSFHQIFPEIVYQTHINDSELIKEKFANRIINKFKHDPDESYQWGHNCNTWQVKANKEIESLFYVYFEDHVRKWFEYSNFPPLKYNVEMWVNVHTYEMYQDNHIHMGGKNLLSGNYNLLFHEKDRPMLFSDFRNYTSMVDSIGIEVDHWAGDRFSQRQIEIKEGDLLLFPPTLPHQVPCALEKHDGHRITISFNVNLDEAHR